MRLDDRRAVEEPPDVGGRLLLTLERPRAVHRRQEARPRALERLERERAREIGRRGEATSAHDAERRHRRHELRPVDEREPLLAREPDRARARPRAARPRRRAARPSTVACPSPTSGSARCASGARSPLAPTEPRAGTSGSTPRLRHSSSSSTVDDARPGEPLRERVRAQEHRRAHDVVRIRLADAARMAAQETELELLAPAPPGCAPRRSGRSPC